MALVRVACRARDCVLSLVLLLSTFLFSTNALLAEWGFCIDSTNTFFNVFISHDQGSQSNLPTNTLVTTINGASASFAATRVFTGPILEFQDCPTETCPEFQCNSAGVFFGGGCGGQVNWIQFSIPICDIGTNPEFTIVEISSGSLQLSDACPNLLFPSVVGTVGALDTSTCIDDQHFPTDQTSGFDMIQKFSLPASTSTSESFSPVNSKSTGSGASFVLELPKVKAGTKVTCSMTCNKERYGGTSPNQGDAETFVMAGIFSDSINPVTDIIYNRGVIESKVSNACEARIR